MKRSVSTDRADSEMQRAFVDGQRRLMHDFGQRRMRMTDTRQIFGRTGELHRHHGFTDQFGGIRAKDVNTKDAIGLRIRQNFHKALGRRHSYRATVGGERNLADAIVDIIRLELLFGFADPGNLGVGIDHPGYGVVITLSCLTSNDLGNHHALFHRLVSQHRSAHDITDGPNARQRRGAMRVHLDETTFVDLQPHAFGVQTVRVRHTSNRHDQTIGRELLLLAVRVCVHDRHTATRLLDPTDRTPELNIEPLPGKKLERFFGDVSIGDSEKIGRDFKYGHLRAETAPHRPHLKADRPRADDDKFLRYGGEIQGSNVIAHNLVIDLDIGQITRTGTGGNDDVGGQHFFLAHLHPPALAVALDEASVTVDQRDLVLAKQALDTAGQLIDDAVLAFQHLRDIDFRLFNEDALRGKALPRRLFKLV